MFGWIKRWNQRRAADRAAFDKYRREYLLPWLERRVGLQLDPDDKRAIRAAMGLVSKSELAAVWSDTELVRRSLREQARAAV